MYHQAPVFYYKTWSNNQPTRIPENIDLSCQLEQHDIGLLRWGTVLQETQDFTG